MWGVILSDFSKQKIKESLFSLSFFSGITSSSSPNYSYMIGKQDPRNIDYNFTVESDKDHFR